MHDLANQHHYELIYWPFLLYQGVDSLLIGEAFTLVKRPSSLDQEIENPIKFVIEFGVFDGATNFTR